MFGACSRETVGLVKLYKFRALISLDGREPEGPPRSYPSGTHSLMVWCARLGQPAVQRNFPATIFPTDDGLLNPGGKAVAVTIETAISLDRYGLAGYGATKAGVSR